MHLDKLEFLALNDRLDRRALEKNLSSSEITLKRSENDLLPELNVQLSGQYTASKATYDTGQIRQLYLAPNRIGPSAGAVLTLVMPLQNSAAEGVVTSSRASVSQYRMRLVDWGNTMHSDVSIALDKLRTHTRNYKRAADAKGMLEEVATETTRKLSLGESTMTDVLSVESRLLDARLRVIQINQNYAKALAELRYVTGTLAAGYGENLKIDWRMLTTAPEVQ